MHSPERPPFSGFWSYASEQKELCGALHGALARGLREHFGRARAVEIFRDDRIQAGHRFQKEIVTAIASSAAFFCVQSPCSFSSPACQFELAMFQDQVNRVAQRFSTPSRKIDAEHLTECWFFPIRWVDINRSLLPELIKTDEDRVRYDLWFSRQIPDAFNVEATQRSERDFARLANGIAKAVVNDAYDNAMKLFPNNDMDAVLSFLNKRDEDFIAYWARQFPSGDEFNARAALAGTAQRRLADWHTGGNTRNRVSKLGTELFLMPLNDDGTDGLWVMTKPFGDPHAAWFQQNLGTGRRSVYGNWLWPQNAAQEISATLSQLDLQMPDARQAARLRAMAERGAEACAQLGWSGPVINFWMRGEQGEVTPAGEPARELPVLLIRKLADKR